MEEEKKKKAHGTNAEMQSNLKSLWFIARDFFVFGLFVVQKMLIGHLLAWLTILIKVLKNNDGSLVKSKICSQTNLSNWSFSKGNLCVIFSGIFLYVRFCFQDSLMPPVDLEARLFKIHAAKSLIA